MGSDLKGRRRVMRHPSRAELVASALRDRIVDGVLGDGDELPKLEELLDEFGVSKPTLREALRILEAEGLITVRRGKVGGAVVHTPRAQNAAYTLGLVMRTEHVTLADVAVALQRLEPACAALCAERIDRATEVVPVLESVHADAIDAAEQDEEAFIAAAGRFHAQLVASCGNSTMILVAGALESIWLAHAEVLVREGPGRSPTTAERGRAIAVHAKVLDRIRRGDPEGAYRATHRHLLHAQAFPLAEVDVPIRLMAPHGPPTIGGFRR
ncbi:MAG TPA: FCD domain-containing protein [Acidimicrobiales bacterium]|jgi:DNA-binding FadR family transcriptional regulator|nr:FCD domain-containing protein [Acidimicrobiales bacterium]